MTDPQSQRGGSGRGKSWLMKYLGVFFPSNRCSELLVECRGYIRCCYAGPNPTSMAEMAKRNNKLARGVCRYRAVGLRLPSASGTRLLVPDPRFHYMQARKVTALRRLLPPPWTATFPIPIEAAIFYPPNNVSSTEVLPSVVESPRFSIC